MNHKTSEPFDVVVIGSGPGGYVAALKAQAAGLRTAIVEKDERFGGTCLHVGCIPSKVFLHTASLLDEIRAAKKLGIEVAAPHLDWNGLQRRARRVIAKLAGGVSLLLKRGGVEAFHGFGRLAGPGRVEVVAPGESGGRQLEARSVIIATGSEARTLPFLPLDGERIVTNAEMFSLDALPERLGIIGAGAVGAEFASMFRSYGAEVELFEVLPRVLPLEDAEVSDVVERAFRKRKIRVRTGARVEAAEVTATGVQVRYQADGDAGTAEYDRLLVAVGRAPRTTDIGLETVGIERERGGFIPVDGLCRTSAPGVFAIGDVVGTAQLAHVASAEAEVAVAAAAGREARPLRRDRMPAATYCVPEVGSVGLTEEAAAAAGHELRVGRFPFAANSKANILGDPTGFVKVVAEARYDEVLGVHIVGPHATDLIAEAVVALDHEATLESLARSVHPHPTLSEAVAEAALAASGAPLHA
jgi:dihydrolipoamide dehydrogenase